MVFSTALLSFVLSLAPPAIAAPTPELKRDPITVWNELDALKGLKKAERAKKEKALYSGPVEIGGYIVANEFGDAAITEFLLTQIPGGCVHVPLPPPEKMIHVVMKPGKTSPVYFGKRVAVKGTLSAGGRIDSSFELSGDEVREFPIN